MSSNKNKLDEYNNTKVVLEEKQESILLKKANLDDTMNSLNVKLNELVYKREEQEHKIKEFQNLKIKYQNEIAENEARISSAVNARSNETVYESKSIEVTSTSTSSNSLVNIAFKYLGVPYLWGGTTPSGFDCSGFVQYVYREAGINISRTTYEQITEGYSVSELQPGDLVFFGSYDAPYHVGIYIGNGQYIHSPTTGDVVKIASLQYRRDYCGARRYL